MDEEIRELLPFYALGTCSEAERARVEAYLDAHPELRPEVESYLSASDALAFAAAPVEVSPQVRAALLERIHNQGGAQAARSPPWDWLGWLRGTMSDRALSGLTSASLLAAIAALVWGLSLNAEVASLREQIARLEADFIAQQQVLARISDPSLPSYTVRGTEHQPGAHGRVFVDAQARSVLLITSALEPLAPDLVYQLWLIGDTPMSAGTFAVDPAREAQFAVLLQTDIPAFQAIGVSIEPRGGSLAPTGDIVLFGALAGDS